MCRAGLAVARLALALAPHAQRFWLAAGPGNNGGDALEAALQLRLMGQAVTVSLAADPARLPPDALACLQRAHKGGVTIRTDPAAWAEQAHLGPHDLAIDGLLGLGGSRAPTGPLATLIGLLNLQRDRVLAIDLPSGLNADTGQALGAETVQAAHTLALLTLKPGLFTGAGRQLAGTVWFDGLGIDPALLQTDCAPLANLAGPSQLGRWAAVAGHAAHKGSHGDVLVLAGAAGMGGAALLASRAAHAAGAGRVWMVPLDPDAWRIDPLRPELMWRAGLATFDAAALAQSTVVCGCGGGEAVAAELPRLLREVPRLVLDADALNALSRDAALQALLRDRAAQHQHTILTPHPLEAARLLACTSDAVQADRLQAASDLVDRYRCVVVLKGSGSVLAAPGLRPHINASGNAALATAGTGDVLAGWMGGCWSSAAGGARHAAGQARSDAATLAFEAARASVWHHGAVAEATGLALVRAADLIELMARAG